MTEFGETPSSWNNDSSEAMKQPIKKLELAINRFTKIAIPLDLERLGNHCKNIQKYQQQQLWEKLRVEQINARRTVQQLKANVREMEKVRLQVNDDDLQAFDDQVSPVKDEVIQAVVKVIELCGVESSPLDPPVMTESLTGSLIGSDHDALSCRFRHNNSSEANNHSSSLESGDTSHDPTSHDPLISPPALQQTQQEVAVPSQHVDESWTHLHKELVELNSLTHEFAAQVQEQQAAVDSIENNVHNAGLNVSSGVKHLLQASKFKSAMLPIGGALIGGIVGGPVGIVAGMKVGAAAALGGGAIGFFSGRALKKRQEKRLTMEMSVLLDKDNDTNSSTENTKDK